MPSKPWLKASSSGSAFCPGMPVASQPKEQASTEEAKTQEQLVEVKTDTNTEANAEATEKLAESVQNLADVIEQNAEGKEAAKDEIVEESTEAPVTDVQQEEATNEANTQIEAAQANLQQDEINSQIPDSND